MKAAWNFRPLGEVCKLLNGRAYNKEELLAEGPTPVLRVGNFFTNRNWYYSDLTLGEDKYCDDGDLLYAWSASFGPRIWQGGRVIYHYHIWKTQPDPNLLDKQFLFHFLDWDKENIKAAQGAGTTMIHVTKGAMEARLMPVPPLDEQRRIVAVLDKAFAGIATVTANAQKNLTNVRALFESCLDQIFASGGDDWSVRPFEDCLQKVKYTAKVQRKDFKQAGKFPIISQEADFINGYWDRPEDALNVESPMVVFGDHTQVLKYVDFDFVLGADGVKLLLPIPTLSAKFLLYFLKANPINSIGYARHYRLLKELKIRFPNLTTQLEITERLDRFSVQMTELEDTYDSKLTSLSELKQSLLQKAFAGELT